ncbi:MAG: hypothetical protein P857_931 [Candidatus Xenolissoclinum pacificiensis L6]|uniref:Uncharacterized protein n=1 Tax=Candidatus Xenolissoclinum pacificiensis L6 TaxID=1401685 RepID=W2V287_9RICK|nr:MAG: hypothetical protein P857_931 [Candidatus Xenolissoclinum pacificiensis L6]
MFFNTSILKLLKSPESGLSLSYSQEKSSLSDEDGNVYPVIDGIAVFFKTK